MNLNEDIKYNFFYFNNNFNNAKNIYSEFEMKTFQTLILTTFMNIRPKKEIKINPQLNLRSNKKYKKRAHHSRPQTYVVTFFSTEPPKCMEGKKKKLDPLFRYSKSSP